MKTIYFDMDGTIADLYGYDNWLEKIKAESIAPYINAKPLINMASFARKLGELQRKGFNVGIISWTAKGGSKDYNNCVAYAKVQWLRKHLPSIYFDSIVVCEYGRAKSEFADCGDILFDDEIGNRKEWEECGTMTAYDEKDIISTLCAITRGLTP